MEAVELMSATDRAILPMRARARPGAVLPPAVVNPYPKEENSLATNSSASLTASRVTVPFTLEPSPDQLVPFHLAMLRSPPSVANKPPTYKSVPDAASAYTSGSPESKGFPFSCEPTADQLLPSHLARRQIGRPPAPMKRPPTY